MYSLIRAAHGRHLRYYSAAHGRHAEHGSHFLWRPLSTISFTTLPMFKVPFLLTVCTTYAHTLYYNGLFFLLYRMDPKVRQEAIDHCKFKLDKGKFEIKKAEQGM